MSITFILNNHGGNRGDRLFNVNLFNQKPVAMIVLFNQKPIAMILPMSLVKGGGEVVEL